MPGTIQVSILEVVGLPSLQKSSSMGITVSMGKQAYDTEEKGDFSFVLASLRDNLRVTVHDSEGNEIGHTGVESRSIVEKGMWDDIFPLQGGGHVRMRLHFILTEEEQKRIRSMRESAARKKHEDLLKRSHSSSDLAVASGDSLKTSQQAQDGIVNLAGTQPYKMSPGSSAKVPSQIHHVQKKQAFSTSKSTGALDKLPDYQRVKKEIQHQNEEQQSQLDKTPSNVKNMILAFESSPVKEASPDTSKTRAATRVSSITTTDVPLKAPKKTVALSSTPVLPKLKTVPAPIYKEKVKEKEKVMTDTPLKFSKKMVSVTVKPVLSNLETLPAPISKEIVPEKDESGDYVDSCQETSCSTTMTDNPVTVPKNMVYVTTKPALSNLATLPVPMSEETVPEMEVGVLGDYVDACAETLAPNTEQFKELGIHSIEQMSNEKNIFHPEPANEVSKEEIISPNKLHSRLAAFGQSKFSWKMLSRGLPRRIADNSFMKNQISTSFDSSVFEKKWRSKHQKSCEHNVKPKVSCGNKYYPSGSFHGWIFLEEMILSSVRSDDRPLIDQLEGGYSNCSPDAIQEKLRDTDVVPSKDDKSSVELTASGPGERPDSRPYIRPVVNIVIMIGFGILVFLTRHRK